MNSKCIIIIANDPEKSQDLAAFENIFGKQKAFYLGRAMLFDTLALCLSIPRTDLILYYHPDDSRESYRGMLELFAHEESDKKIVNKIDNIKLVSQAGEMMMDRITDAFANVFEQGYKRAEMIGAYCVPLDHHLINAGYVLLKNLDVVIGPSFNGRYYLFGMSRPILDIFRGVLWESNDFYVRLNENMKQAGVKFQELELSYEVYTPEELNQLIIDIERWRSLGDEKTAYHTEKCLRAIMGK